MPRPKGSKNKPKTLTISRNSIQSAGKRGRKPKAAQRLWQNPISLPNGHTLIGEQISGKIYYLVSSASGDVLVLREIKVEGEEVTPAPVVNPKTPPPRSAAGALSVSSASIEDNEDYFVGRVGRNDEAA